MIKHYIRVALRNILKHKASSIINTTGLSVGIACCLLIMLYVTHEVSYDRFHPDADRIYRVVHVAAGNQMRQGEGTPVALGPAMKNDFPEIELAVRATTSFRPVVVQTGDQMFEEEGVATVEPDFLRLFRFEFISGDPATALNEPFSVIISEDIAVKCFGKDLPLHKALRIGTTDYQVTGVVKNAPANSELKYKVLTTSVSSRLFREMSTHWGNNFVVTYVKLRAGCTKEALEQKLHEFLKRRAEQEASGYTLKLQPLTRIHLFSNSEYRIESTGDYRLVIAYSAFAAFILLIACINYVNLSIGQLSARMMEIGIRKVLGAGKRQLVFQYWSEVLVLCVVASGIAILAVYAAFPSFNSLANRAIAFSFNSTTLCGIAAILLGTCILAGAFPSLVIAGLTPVDILRKRIMLGGSNRLTKILVVAQFTLSIFFFICTGVMSDQIGFILSSLNRLQDERVLTIQLRGLSAAGISTIQEQSRLAVLLQEKMKQRPRILSTSAEPGGVSLYQFTINGAPAAYPMQECDYGFVETNGLQMKEGRFFSMEYPSDSVNAIVVNEAFVQQNNLSSPVGMEISAQSSRYRIIGVLKNHHSSYFTNYAGRIYKLGTSGVGYVRLKVAKDAVPEVLQFVQQEWKKLFPHAFLSYSFRDEDNARTYSSEIRAQKLLSIVSMVAILLSCFGILGLTSMTMARRVKEAGIRKVFGASVSDLVFLFTRDYLWLVAASTALASPIAFDAMNHWLQDYAYRVPFRLELVLFSAVGVLIAAIATVSLYTVRAARANPVDSLRCE